MIPSGFPAFGTILCAETVGPAVAFFSGLLLSSSSSSVSSSSLSTVPVVPLWFILRLVLVILVLWLVWRVLLIGSMVVGLVRGWEGMMVRSRGRRECRVSLVLVYWSLLNDLRSVVQLILKVNYFVSKVLEHVLHVGILLSCLS